MRINMYHGQHFLEPFANTLRNVGFEVDMSADQDFFERIQEVGDVRHLIWGWRPELAAQPKTYHDMLATRRDVWFAERGWMPQKEMLYVDPVGVNAISSLLNTTINQPPPDNDVFKEKLLAYHKGISRAGNGYIFVPLQTADDSTIKYWSKIPNGIGHKVLWFAKKMCELFHDEVVVIRPHPNDRGTLGGRLATMLKMFPKARVETKGNSMSWAAGARAVVGIKSTTLIESLSYYKPVAALGTGIFSGNGVVLEANGDIEAMRGVLDMTIPVERIKAFLWMLFHRQFPVTIQPEAFEQYPVLRNFTADRQAVLAVPRTPLPTIKSATNVYGFVEYPDLLEQNVPARLTESMSQPNVQGVLLNDFVLEDWEADWAAAQDFEVIPMFTEDLDWPHLRRLERAKRIGRRIAVGNTVLHEWTGGHAEAAKFFQYARDHEFEWACTLTHYSLLMDMKNGGRLRRMFAEHGTLVFCLCGQVLIGYCYGEERMPGLNATSLTNRNLHNDYGLTAKSLREYCEPLNIYSGAGGPPGLTLGTRGYAKEMGFKGVICWCPFDLTGSLDVPLKAPSTKLWARCRGADVGIGDEHRRTA